MLCAVLVFSISEVNAIYYYIVLLLDVVVPSCLETLPTKKCSTTSTGRPSVMPLRIQLFRHSPVLIVSALRDIPSHEIVRRAPERHVQGLQTLQILKEYQWPSLIGVGTLLTAHHEATR
jgi:hypothetical protein